MQHLSLEGCLQRWWLVPVDIIKAWIQQRVSLCPLDLSALSSAFREFPPSCVKRCILGLPQMHLVTLLQCAVILSWLNVA